MLRFDAGTNVAAKPTYQEPKESTKGDIKYGLYAGDLCDDVDRVIMRCAIEHGRSLMLYVVCTSRQLYTPQAKPRGRWVTCPAVG